MSRRQARQQRAAVVRSKREALGPEPEDDVDGEGDTPDVWPAESWLVELIEQHKAQQRMTEGSGTTFKANHG